jgi:hypothetical protein
LPAVTRSSIAYPVGTERGGISKWQLQRHTSRQVTTSSAGIARAICLSPS